MNSAEFSESLSQIYPKLWLIAVGLSGDRALADDIVQDSAVIATQKIDQFERNSNFVAWMSKIVRLTALNYVRKNQRRNTSPEDPERLNRILQTERAEWVCESVERFPWQELSDDQPHFDDALFAALKSLSSEARACLLLRTIAEMTYAEIGELLELPANTAMSHVHRAKRRLRDRLRAQLSRRWAKQ